MSKPIYGPETESKISGVRSRTSNLERRPAPAAAGSALKWAVASYGQQTHTISGGVIRFRFNDLETNDTSAFALSNQSEDTIRAGTNSWADYLQVNDEGFYWARFQYNDGNNNAFNTFYTYLEPLSGTISADQTLINEVNFAQWANTFTPHAESNAASEWYHQTVWCDIHMWYTAASWGGSPLKLGMRIQTAKTGSVTSLGCSLLVVQLAPATPAYVDTYIG